MISYIKNLEKPVQKFRFIIQSVFVLLCIWIGIEFYLFVNYLESGGAATFYSRPPGAEAFLPISSMMSVYNFFFTGEIHHAHPAGFFIFIAILLVSLVFGKAFCSWMCPVGFLSELIGDFGEEVQKKLFKRVLTIPRWLDYPLRSLKYLILGFFVNAIFIAMPVKLIGSFLDAPYNIMSDVKMYDFFANMTQFSILVIAGLFVLSIVIRNFWCRYLCPYGALLGITSLLSPNKVTRNEDNCIDCNLCANACPSRIKVDKVKTVISDECSTCLSCVDACPVKDTLQVQTVFTKKKISKRVVAFGIIMIYIAITGLAILTHKWDNQITKEEYLHYYKVLDKIGHN